MYTVTVDMLNEKLRIADIGRPSNSEATCETNNVLRKVLYIRKRNNTEKLNVSYDRKFVECNQNCYGKTFWKIITS
jgi:hypothetical protein